MRWHRPAPARIRRGLLVLALALTVALVAGLAASAVIGWALTRPMNERVGAAPADLPARDVTIHSETGRDVRGWLVPGRPDRAGILLLHGLRGDRRSMVPRARLLHRLGYTVLLIDLQAHGESPGAAMTFGARESLDVRAAARYLGAVVPGRPVGAIGVSLGGAAVVLAEPPVPFDAVVLESVYSSFDTAVDNRMRRRLGPPGPLVSGLLTWQVPLRLGISTAALRPVDRIGQVQAPVLLVQGDRDRSTTLAEGRRMFAAAAEPKQLWVVPGAGHVDLYRYAPQRYEATVAAFLARWLPPVPAATVTPSVRSSLRGVPRFGRLVLDSA